MFVLMRLKEDGNLVPPVGTNCICNPSHVTKVLKEFWKDSPTEQIVVISLNSAGQPVNIRVVSSGTVNEAVVTPREIFRGALRDNALNIIMAHNHPGGSSIPSLDDLKVTRRLIKAGRLLGIEVRDHIIIAGDVVTSLNATREDLWE